MSRRRHESSSPPPAQRGTLPAYEPPILPMYPKALEALTSTMPTLYDSPSKLLSAALSSLTEAASAAGCRENVPKALLDQLEQAARSVVDANAKLMGSKNVVAKIAEEERVRGVWDDEGEDDEDAHAVRVEEGIWGRYKKGVEEETTKWEEMGLRERYAPNHDYRVFRETLWDVQNPERPVPNDRQWFAEEGDGAAGESDDDLEIHREVVNYNCPLTMQRFKEPMESVKCHHNFEKAAIFEMIAAAPMGPDRVRRVECPNFGCAAKIGKVDLRENTHLLAKMKRAEEREEMLRRKAELEDEEEEEEEEEEENWPKPTQEQIRIKKEKGKASGSRGKVLSLSDEDD